MKVYCGDYMNHLRPKRRRWLSLGIIGACILFTSAATPAMVSYYWSGQYSTKNLALDEAIKLAQDESRPVHARKSAQAIAFINAKRAIQALQAPKGPEVLNMHSGEYLKKLEVLFKGR